MGFAKSLLGGGKSSVGFRVEGPSSAQLNTSWEQQQAGIKQQQDFVNALQAQNGIGNQSNVFGQMQGLAGQLGDISQGNGPNPAMAALAQSTGQNVSNQAALMAGQRGASANTGLIARQAGMQGANTQQQAVGQAATMQAQQQLAALGQLQNQQANLANVAGQQVGQQQAGLTEYGNQTGQQRGQLLGQQSNANNINAQMAQNQSTMQGQLLGNLAGGVGSAIMAGGKGGFLGNIFGGAAKKEAEGGLIQSNGPRSAYGMMMATGGKVPALVSPGEVYLKPNEVAQVAQGTKNPMDGEKIPGKAKVKGAKNDYANDTVSKTLDEGGIVIPRSVTQSADKDRKAIEFVQAILSKHSKSLPKK